MDPIDRAADAVASAGRVVALTGAGISAGSGIATFRDAGGLWDRFDPVKLGSSDGWMGMLIAEPWTGVELLQGLRDAFAAARPNAGHVALAELEHDGRLAGVITQNVDGLHGDAGSRRLIELHGSFRRRRCPACGSVEDIGAAGLLDEIDRMIDKLSSYMVTHPAHLLVRCGCGGLTHPDVVGFGDDVHDLDAALSEARTADVMLVCGTSGVVYPAAGLPEIAKERGALIVEVNPEPTELTRLADVHLCGPAEDVLPALRRAVAAAPAHR